MPPEAGETMLRMVVKSGSRVDASKVTSVTQRINCTYIPTYLHGHTLVLGPEGVFTVTYRWRARFYEPFQCFEALVFAK